MHLVRSNNMQTKHNISLSIAPALTAGQQQNPVLAGIVRSRFIPAFRASSNGSGIPSEARFFGQVSLAASINRSNAFTQVPVSSLIQERLATGVRTSTIRVIYTGVPQSVKTAFQRAVAIWQTIVASPVPITLQVTWKRDASGVLASSGPNGWWSNFPGAPLKNTWYPVALANKFARRDLNPDIPDGVINLNTRPARPWYVGIDGRVPAGRCDLVTVALHEIYHSLTFSGFMDYSPQANQGAWGFGTGLPGLYDRFTVNASNVSLLNSNRFPNPSQTLGLMLRGDRLFFNGVNAKLANFGQRSKLYAPAVWQPGSSYIHLDERTYPAGNPNSLMTPVLGLAEAIHDPGPITLGMLRDMKWVP